MRITRQIGTNTGPQIVQTATTPVARLNNAAPQFNTVFQHVLHFIVVVEQAVAVQPFQTPMRNLLCGGHKAIRPHDLQILIIPQDQVAAPFLSGAQRDIAALSCVGRSVCFQVTGQRIAADGSTEFLLSRRMAQEEAMEHILRHGMPGMVIRGQVTHLAPFGAFVDVGCGLVALLPLANISVARIRHPAERFALHQRIRAVVQSIDPQQKRIVLSHRELLGTWLENAARFRVGETVPGIVRSCKPYGCFVELTPNLSGLADSREDIPEGRLVSVYIRSIQPQTGKIKLQMVQELGQPDFPTPLHYQITGGSVSGWRYRP